MKKDTHPPYQDILFVDSSNGYKFVCGSTLKSDKKEVFEGKEYPVFYVSVSSASHPFFTGSKQLIDSEGRVDKFLKRYSQKQKSNQDQQEKQKEAEATKPAGKKKSKKA